MLLVSYTLLCLGVLWGIKNLKEIKQVKKLEHLTLQQLEEKLEHPTWALHCATCSECNPLARTRCEVGVQYLLRDILRSKHSPSKLPKDNFGL